jgi:hypothetical protein
MDSAIISKATDLLLAMYSDELDLFSSSTRVGPYGYVNEFVLRPALRYSAVSLLGLQKSFGVIGESSRFPSMLDRFAKRYWTRIDNVGDLGVLCSLLNSIEHPLERPVFEAIKASCAGQDFIARSTVQEICQLLTALCEMHVRHASGGCESLAREIWSRLLTHYHYSKTGFCCHGPTWYRRAFVSFGGMTYYLRAVNDFGQTFEDESANGLYERVLKRVLELQGPRGEWPWFFNAFTANVAELYEIYSVHQHAMSFLFLFPALAQGNESVIDPIRRSYRWIFGNNELGIPMVELEPFFIYRSIRRREGLPQLKRFIRAAAWSCMGGVPTFATPESLEVNKECRSYEIGWLLYAWSRQSQFKEFQSLDLARSGCRTLNEK